MSNQGYYSGQQQGGYPPQQGGYGPQPPQQVCILSIRPQCPWYSTNNDRPMDHPEVTTNNHLYDSKPPCTCTDFLTVLQMGYPPQQPYPPQGPPPKQSRGGGGCLGACLAALCCCCVAEEGCEACADCAGASISHTIFPSISLTNLRRVLRGMLLNAQCELYDLHQLHTHDKKDTVTLGSTWRIQNWLFVDTGDTRRDNEMAHYG